MNDIPQTEITPLEPRNAASPARLVLTGIAIFAFALVLMPAGGERSPGAPRGAPESSVSRANSENPFEKITLSAQAAYVLDVTTGKELYGVNADAQLPLASLAKIMTAIVALDLVPTSTIITVEKNFLDTEGDSGLSVGERWRLQDLLALTLLASSNDGADAIASVSGSLEAGTGNVSRGREAFVEEMNKRARALGLTQTYFVNETGLDQSAEISGAYGSARDMARLLGYAITAHPELFAGTAERKLTVMSLSGITHTLTNTNAAVDRIPRLIGGKTGYTDLAGGNLAIAFDAGFGKPIAVVVLGSTEKGRFDDAVALVWATLRRLRLEETEKPAER